MSEARLAAVAEPAPRSHEVMTADVVDALGRRQPKDAERAMTLYITRRHQDIRALL